jgi:UDP-N-acetylmuramoyl-tripeptide--D-alanyl-D-alanine ligase
MDVIETKNIAILNDTYNANPTSMEAAISIAAKSSGRSVCILGDMFELGHSGAGFHRDIGRCAAKEKIGLIICVGNLSKYICEAAKEEGAVALHFPDKESLIEELPSQLRKGDTVLVKASHGMHLETIVKWLSDNF